MRTTIDTAGRIVIPKELRDALGLKPGQVLEIHTSDKGLEIELASTDISSKQTEGGVVAVPVDGLPILTATEVRETLERIRR